MGKPTVGIFGLTGCAGDQLVVLNCEDQLLDLVALLDIRDFLTASSTGDRTGPLDIALVEGAVVSARDEAALRDIRNRSALLVAIGTCAVWGGIPAMDRGVDAARLMTDLYGPVGAEYDRQPARALHEIVPVDHAITGCPIEQAEFLSAISCLLDGNAPVQRPYAVCVECKMRECACLLTSGRAACLGPVTQAGCNARCPALGVPCIGCRGPVDDANMASAVAAYGEHVGVGIAAMQRRLATFAPAGSAGEGRGEEPR